MLSHLHFNLALKTGTEAVGYSAFVPPCTDFCIISYVHAFWGQVKIHGIIFFPLHLRKELLVCAGYWVVARGGKERKRMPCITTEDGKAYNNPQFLIVLRNRSGRGYGSCYFIAAPSSFSFPTESA